MEEDIKRIADLADVIIDGFAFTRKGDLFYITNLHQINHDAVVLSSGEVRSTNMDEIELVIALQYFESAKKYMKLIETV